MGLLPACGSGSDSTPWTEALAAKNSSGRHSRFELLEIESTDTRFIRITGLGNSDKDENGIIEVEAHKQAN